jgi:hypothetical protein
MSRKYGQRGYQESDRDRQSQRGPAPPRSEPLPPRHQPDKPRGRGLGAPTELVFKCAVCGTAQAAPAPETFGATCEKCSTDLHTCTHCASFDTSSRWECRRWQERAAPVGKKSQRNDCALMTPRTAVEHAKEKVDPNDPRAAFDALFKF